MPLEYFGFQSALIATDGQWSTLHAIMAADGIDKSYLNKMIVAPGSGRAVTVATGRGLIQGMPFVHASSESLAVTANGSGNPRHDLVVVEIDFDAEVIQLKVVAGTPAVSPTVPAFTQTATIWQIPLARVVAVNGFSSLSSGDIEDFRPWVRSNVRQKSISGAPISTASTSNVVITGVTITMYCTGGSVKVTLTGNTYSADTSYATLFSTRVDGLTPVALATAQHAQANANVPLSSSYVFEGISTGFHVFDFLWAVSNAARTANIDSTTKMRVEEMP